MHFRAGLSSARTVWIEVLRQNEERAGDSPALKERRVIAHGYLAAESVEADEHPDSERSRRYCRTGYKQFNWSPCDKATQYRRVSNGGYHGG